MNVRVKISLTTPPTNRHKADMYRVACYLTSDKRSVTVFQLPDDPEILVAEFSIKRARQSDVVDKIGKSFSHVMVDYSDATIAFPKRK